MQQNITTPEWKKPAKAPRCSHEDQADEVRPKTASQHYHRLISDPWYRRRVAEKREPGQTRGITDRLVLLRIHDPVVCALEESDTLGFMAKETDLCLAVILVDRGCSPDEVAHVLWSQDHNFSRNPVQGAAYIRNVVLRSFELIAAGEEAKRRLGLEGSEAQLG